MSWKTWIHDPAQQNHWSERRRVTSVGNAEALGRLRRSVPSLGVMTALAHGEIANWLSREELAAALRQAGLQVYVGRYSVRIEDCSHFIFESYGGDLGPPDLS